jgi:putative CocE/NonD family hydrolase
MTQTRPKLLLTLLALALTLTTLGLAPATAETAAPPTDFIAQAGTLSQPDYPQIGTESTRVEMHDGETLYVEITRPDPATYGELQLPVILEASPYHGANATRIGDRMFPDPKDENGNNLGLTGYFAPRGYNVVMVDLRGTGRSTGCLDHLGPNDAQDLKTVIEWAASQSWSSGKVGMTGHSYVGSTPKVAAAMNPEGLATIIPSAGLASMYDHQFQKGVPYLLQWVGPQVAYETLAMQRDLPPGSPTPPVIGSGDTADNWENGPNPQFGCGWQNSALTAGSGQVTGQYEGWHAARDWREGAQAADIPVFMIHGVNDNAARIPAAEWFFGGRFDREQDKVWIGQWDHGSTNGRCGDVNGSRTLHPTCRFDQMKYAIHAWFDKHLKGADVDTGPAVEAFLNGAEAVNISQVIDPETLFGKIYTADAWSAPTTFTDLSLDASDMSLKLGEAEAEASETFSSTANAVAAHYESGSLTFASEPVATDTVFLGLPTFTLNAATTQQITHLVATLYRVDEFGLREPMNTCAIQPALRDGVETFSPVTPGEEMELPMTCFTMAHWVPAGNTLELEIATAGAHHATFGTQPEVTVFTGPGKSHYSLPVAPPAPLYDDVPLREAQ